ncbi:putative inorganic phosphate cotransporter [Trichogramma pretiosum]|uniref:putative inorganic phosphate cotransporter n=1 Tax=Trichogramma pretiosum TaxID=7493 RepID=UPI0006C981A8|nr:putative inorganic phosphate cotransporter [Trichogramma pretiosum]
MEQTEREKNSNSSASTYGYRHVQVLMLAFGMAIGYTLRVSLSVALIAMKTRNATNPNIRVHDWSLAIHGLVQSSFYWGYVTMQLPSGYLANTFSAAKLLGVGMLACSGLNLLMPIVADEYGYEAVLALRVLMGVAQSCLLPCCHAILSRWAPPRERSRLGSFVINAAQFGTFTSMPIAGLLANSTVGWPGIFYFFGALGLLWSLLFLFIGSDEPSKDSRVSDEEAYYINFSIFRTAGSSGKRSIPWTAIFTSLPVWALTIIHGGNNYGYYTLVTTMPSYMESVSGFDVEGSGVISGLPYFVMWLLGFPFGILSDLAVRKGLSTRFVRNLNNTIGMWVPALALICLCLVDAITSSQVLSVAVFVVVVGINAAVSSGFQINHIDLSPNYAATLMSISNTAGNIVGILAPIISGYIVQDEKNVSQWHTIFYITAAVYILTNSFFIIFGRGNVQPWNNDNTKIRTTSTTVNEVYTIEHNT